MSFPIFGWGQCVHHIELVWMVPQEDIPRVPVICTGNDFSTLYAPLIRDGRMEKFYWAPSRDDRVGVCMGIFQHDGVNKGDVEHLVDTFPGQSIDFFGALRVRKTLLKCLRNGQCLSLYSSSGVLIALESRQQVPPPYRGTCGSTQAVFKAACLLAAC